MGECRNCGATATKDLGFVGELAPFFLKRVLNLECGLAPSQSAMKRFLRRIGVLARFAQKIYGKTVLVEMAICTSCTFVQTKVPFQEEGIGRLYADYRSETYNRERICYEPDYASIAGHVGDCPRELQVRTVELANWLKGKVEVNRDFSMLDFGGADGRFLPNLEGQKFVFDISNATPAEGVTSVQESQLSSYSYVQVAHVLEHVPHPLALTRKAASLLKRGGYLYIEVPKELPDETLTRLANGVAPITLPIHEHINQYSQKSATEVMRAAGMSLVATQQKNIDFGWNRATIIRALGKKD